LRNRIRSADKRYTNPRLP